MTNPSEEQQPQAQPSPQTPYQPSGQYQPSGEPSQQTPYQPSGQYQPSGEPSQQTPYQPGQYQPAGQPAPYGQPYGAPMQEHPQGTMILIFGILGIFITIFAPIAWYLGNKAKADIQTSGIHYSNEQNVSIGRMLGKIFTIIAIVWIAFVIIWIIIAAVAASG